MLILSRLEGETIFVGDDVQVTVLSISGKQVRNGIEAPHNLAVHREEIYNKIQSEKASIADNHMTTDKTS